MNYIYPSTHSYVGCDNVDESVKIFSQEILESDKLTLLEKWKSPIVHAWRQNEFKNIKASEFFDKFKCLNSLYASDLVSI